MASSEKSSASKCHFQSVIFRWGISRAPGSSLGTSPSTPAKMTLVHRSHTQQNKRKQVSFSWKAPRNVPGGNRMPLLLCKGSTPGTQRKLTHRKWHLDSLEKRYHKETVWERFCWTFGWTFWCDLPQNPCFTGQWPGNPSNCSENPLVLFVLFLALSVLLGSWSSLRR